MATATKTDREIIASASISAGGSANGSLSLTTALGATVMAKVTNGGTGPTQGALVTLEVSSDGGTSLFEYAVVRAGTTNSGEYSWAWDLPASVSYVKVTIDDHTGQAVTGQVDASELTSVG